MLLKNSIVYLFNATTSFLSFKTASTGSGSISEDPYLIGLTLVGSVKSVLDRGFWAGFTIYPKTKMSKERMVAVVKKYGSERVIVDSSADWGVSDPLSVPKTAALMEKEGVSKEDIHLTCYQNALSVYGQSGQFNEKDWKQDLLVDQSDRHEGNTILRGQNPEQRNFKN